MKETVKEITLDGRCAFPDYAIVSFILSPYLFIT